MSTINLTSASMMNIDKSLALSDEVNTLCQPLKKHFNICYFNYVRLNPDNSRYLLTDRPDWIGKFYSHKLYNETSVVDIESFKYNDYFVWKKFENDTAFKAAREFNIGNGITLIEPSESHLELYYFATNINETNACELYEKNIDIFKRFTSYIKDKGKNLMAKASSLPIVLDNQNKRPCVTFKDSLEHHIDTIKNSEAYRFAYFSQGKVKFLTNQETLCASYMVLQLSMREIANKLKLSPRTIETHINNIKTKLSCVHKHDLVSSILNLKIVNINDHQSQSGFYPLNFEQLLSFKEFIMETNHHRLYIGGPNNDFYLTKRESEILYYLTKGSSAKSIASLIDCSLKTTELYIYNLRKKFLVTKKSGLVEKVIKEGILKKIFLSFPEIAIR